MPKFEVVAPDGRKFEVTGPEGSTLEQAISYAQKNLYTPKEEPKKQAGFGGSFMDAVTTLGLADEAAAFSANPTPENRAKFLEAAKSKYDSVGGFGKGQDWEYFKELLGGSLGQMAAPLAAGAAGSLAGPVGGLSAMGATSAAQYTIQNLERQAQEQQASIDQGRAPGETSVAKAATAAVGQAGMDVAGTLVFGPLFKAFPFTKGLASGASKEVSIMADAIKNGTLKTVGGGVVKGVGEGVAFEVPQEIAQQALERWQAGLPLGDEDAKSEYLQAAQGAAVLGALFGGASGVVKTGPPAFRARKQAKEERDEISNLEELANAKRTAAPVAAPQSEPRTELDRPANEVFTNGAERDALEPPSITPQADNAEGAGVAGDIAAGSGVSVPDNGGDVRPAGDTAAPSVGAVDGGGLGEAVSPVEPVNEGTRASYDPVEAARKLVLENNNASLSFIQRKLNESGLSVNYPSTVKIVKELEKQGVVTPPDARGRRKVISEATEDELKSGLEEVTPAVSETEPTTDSAEELARLKRIQDRYDAAGKGQEFDPNKSLMDQMMPPTTRGERPAEPDIEPTNITEEDVKPSGPNRYADDIVSKLPKYWEDKINEKGLDAALVMARNQARIAAAKYRVFKNNFNRPIKYNKSDRREVLESHRLEAEAAVAIRDELTRRQNAEANKNKPQPLPNPSVYDPPNKPTMSGEKAFFIKADYSDNPTVAKNEAEVERKRGDSLMRRHPKSATPEQIEARIKWGRDIMRAAQAKIDSIAGPKVLLPPRGGKHLTSSKLLGAASRKARFDSAEASGKYTDAKTIQDRLGQIGENIRITDVALETIEDTDPRVETLETVKADLRKERAALLERIANGEDPNAPIHIENSRFFDDLPATGNWSTQELMAHVRDIETALRYVTRGWAGAPNIFVVSEPKTNTTKLKVYEKGRAQDARTELPAPVYERMKLDGRLRAPALTTADGTVYIIASNIPKGRSDVVKPILFHEAFHSGIVSPEIANKYNMEKDQLMARIYRDNFKYRVKAEAWLAAHPEASFVEEDGQLVTSEQAKSITPIARAMDEVMAEEAESASFKNTPVWERIKAFIRRWARKLFNNDLKFSDKDVEAVLRMAVSSVTDLKYNSQVQNERILDKESVSVASARYAPNSKKPRGVPKSVREKRAKQAAARAAAIEEKTARANPDATFDIMGELMNVTRGGEAAKRSIDRLKTAFASMTPDNIRRVLPVMTTDDVTRWVGGRINNIKPVNDAVTAMGAYRFNWRQDAAPLMEDWISYYQKNPSANKPLSEAMHVARLLQVNPIGFNSAAAQIAADPEITKQKAIEAANQGNTKTENAKRGAAGKVIRERTTDIEIMHKYWASVDDAGKAIFKSAFEYYQKQFKEYMSLLDAEIEKNATDDTKDILQKKMKDMLSSSGVLDVYFPLQRYGKYWFQYKTGADREFYMFPTASARAVALKERIKEAQKSGDARTAEALIEAGELDLGSQTNQAMEKEAGASEILRKLFDSIDSSGGANKTELKLQIFNMYMDTLPANSMKQKLRQSKNITGFSQDVLRNYVTSVNSASNQMAKLKHASDIRNSIAAAWSEIENNPDKDKLSTFIEEIQKRAELELNPNLPEEGEINWDGMATMGNQLVFYYMLTSPKSAIVQMTQLHIVGLPVLSAKYGFGKTMKMAAKYANPFYTFNFVEDGKIVSPTIRSSKLVENEKNPAKRAALIDGWDHANNLDKLMDTFVASTTERGKMPTAQHESVGQTALRRVANFMSGAFHHFERAARAIMYMSAFELEYDTQMAAGKSSQDAKEAAKEEAVLRLEEALFNYSSYNKPRLAKTPLGKLGFQFMSYPMQMTSYLVRNFFTLIRDLPAAEKKAAAIKFFGTIGMTSMYAGVVGLPGYALIMGVADGMKALFGDPGDDDEDNPLAAHNTDIWFRQWFIPTYFGAGVVGRAITYGPVSALTGGDVSGSTSLDGLWLRNDNPPDSYKDGFQQMLLGLTGPFGSMGSQVAAGFDDINNGDLVKGMEKLSPAFLRNFIKTGRYATEGYVTKGNPGDTIKEKEWFTTGKLIGQSMGFTPMEIADIQQKTYALKREAEVIVAKQAKLLDRINRAFAKDDEAEIDRVLEAVEKYNEKYGSVLPITADSLNSSLKNRLAVQAASIQGLRVNGKFRSAADELLGLSLEEEE